MSPKLLILCCMAAILAVARCQIKVVDDVQRARLPEFLTELDLASLEASQEDIESLKKVVKRLAPAKNGEYLMYQVFFGNEELLKEWLKGAGVMGQPGVDFPVLTTIPATKFSCRGLKGGYYADLETNCQVFHICDNGRKISFLCPNGTIFQQSQLICDWWFKVDCGKSAELYEQSAEQLAEDERKRAEVKKMNSEFHRSSGKSNGQVYYQTQNQNVDYDGRQNGRTNPFGQNQEQNNQQESEKNNEGSTSQQQNGRSGNQFGQGQPINAPQTNRGNQYNQNYNSNQQLEGQSASDQQSNRQNFNNYNSRTSGQTKIGQNSQDHFGSTLNSNAYHDEKSNHRSPKAFNDPRSNLNELTSTANPFREYQQPAESAAFATNRNNRYNKSYQYNQFGNYYSPNQISSTEKYQSEVQGSFASGNNDIQQNQAAKKDQAFNANLPFPTFAPIYKPRTTSTTQTPNYPGITTQKSYVNTDVYRHNTATQTPYSNSETVTANPYQQTNTPGYEDTPAAAATRGNYQQNSETSGHTYTASYTQGDTRQPSTQKPYVNTDTYRQTSGFTAVTEVPTTTTWNSYDQAATTPDTRGTESFTSITERYTDNFDGNTVTGSRWNTVTEVTPGTFDIQSLKIEKMSQIPSKNVKSSTQKPYTNSYQEVAVTSRSLSPYDTSFTYKYGKIGSTLGPYIPFTKNYAYTTTTTTTTTKPPVYTATVPTIPDHRKPGGGVPTTETPAYYQTVTTPVKELLEPEREHVIGMLHSLQELEGTAPTTTGSKNGSRIGLNIPPSSGPSTLHSLALYFATASDNFDSNETATDTAVRLNSNAGGEEEGEDNVEKTTTENSASAELPTNLLTQHTINSYSDLFNINSALQPADNITTNTRIAEDDDGDYSSKDDPDNDLDIQQSQGPVTGDNQRNNPKLRELAQVFTHALSAYLQDPDTFRKVLTEIRPTEPPVTLATESTESTTVYPTTQDDYPSATKEKDEVLDFSDVTKASRRKKLTTPYPTTTQTFTTPSETTYQPYYTTSAPDFIDESLNEAQSSDFRSSEEVNRNNFAHEVNHAFRNSNSNELQNFNLDVSGPSGPNEQQNQYDSYVSVGAVSSGNRLGGFQNNSAHTSSPYGKGVKPADAKPIGNDYVPESTPASYAQSDSQATGDLGISYNNDPSKEFGEWRGTNDLVTPRPSQDEELRTYNSEPPSTATTSSYQDNEVISTTREPFRINYYDSSTKDTRYNDESLVTAGSVYSTHRNSYNDLWANDKSTQPAFGVETTTDYPASTRNGDNSGRFNEQSSTNHWTASPTVTRLWETTVFLDPKHINRGLTASGVDTYSTGAETYGTTPVSTGQEILVTDASGVGETTQYGNTNTPAWNWSPNENDSPTAFTLLPNVYSTENTATPAPTYTTHSSIITTITSSVSSSPAKSSRKEKSFPLRINVSAFNVTENEIVKAQEMFGNLNATSTNTLMKVMKQADNNSTVRQLVLLLISHCKGPMNKTMEQEKEQLLDALLRMPVNEFSSDESRDIITGINQLQLPIGRSAKVEDKVQLAVSTTTTVPVTTFRSRKGRKYRPSTKTATSSSSSVRSGDGDIPETGNSLSIEAGSPSDNRALELLRSLYTIAAKWG